VNILPPKGGSYTDSPQSKLQLRGLGHSDPLSTRLPHDVDLGVRTPATAFTFDSTSDGATVRRRATGRRERHRTRAVPEASTATS
jgi:hypothetical protein